MFIKKQFGFTISTKFEFQSIYKSINNTDIFLSLRTNLLFMGSNGYRHFFLNPFQINLILEFI